MKFKVGDIVIARVEGHLFTSKSFNRVVIEYLPESTVDGPGVEHFYTCMHIDSSRRARTFYKEHEMRSIEDPNTLLKDIL